MLSDFQKCFAGRFPSKFAVQWILKIPPHLTFVFACFCWQQAINDNVNVSLPCETLVSTKQAINDKLHGSVTTYLRCGGVVNNQIKKGLLLSVWAKNLSEICEYLAKLQARAWLSHALWAPGQHTAKRRRKCTRQVVIMAKISNSSLKSSFSTKKKNLPCDLL